MGSLASTRYLGAYSRAEILCVTARDKRLRPILVQNSQAYYHAALAVLVSGWEAYLEEVVREFAKNIFRQRDPSYAALHQTYRQFADDLLAKFNTPNFDNSRSLISRCTGYDPYSAWSWKQRRMSVQAVQDLLNEILQVRHSFAHGFPMKSYSWNTSASGAVRLNGKSLANVNSLLRHLVEQTDKGLLTHIIATYDPNFRW